MAKWEALNAEHEELARGVGLDPDALVVKKVSEGAVVFLNLRTGQQIYISETGVIFA